MRAFLRFVFLLTLLIVTAAGALIYDGHQQLSTPLHYQQDESLLIEPGTRLRGIVLDLYDRGRLANVRQGLYLELYARYTGDAGRIKAGEYGMRPGMTAFDALALWISGKVVTYELRVVEGSRFDNALAQLLAHPQIRKTLTSTDSAEVMRAIGREGQHPEGRFFPDTYVFPRDTTDVAILKRAFDAMDAALASEWATRDGDLPYASPEQALVMASIIEKETGLASERAQIAGVFVRRLRLGMRLQTDPTVIYGLGAEFDGNLRKRDLLAANPYNTYLNSGLPPTPICLPGRAAIHAALHPAAGDTLFFVSRGDGSHEFSATLQQHEDAVRRYQLKGRR
jgi:UPF0755 protein